MSGQKVTPYIRLALKVELAKRELRKDQLTRSESKDETGDKATVLADALDIALQSVPLAERHFARKVAETTLEVLEEFPEREQEAVLRGLAVDDTLAAGVRDGETATVRACVNFIQQVAARLESGRVSGWITESI